MSAPPSIRFSEWLVPRNNFKQKLEGLSAWDLGNPGFRLPAAPNLPPNSLQHLKIILGNSIPVVPELPDQTLLQPPNLLFQSPYLFSQLLQQMAAFYSALLLKHLLNINVVVVIEKVKLRELLYFFGYA